MTLILHKGAALIPYDGLRALSTPEPTATHVPIPHFRIVDIVKHMLAFYGHEVTEEAHATTEDGGQYFGLLTLKSNYGNYTDNVGLRNSHDKKFPIGMCFGSTVFVCDNLAFSSNQVVARKHTKNAKHELPALISAMVEPLAIEREAQNRKLLSYQRTALTDQLAHHAVVEMYKQDIINVTRIPDVLNQWDKPTHDWGEKSVWRLFNACTFALAGRVAENPSTTTNLHHLMDEMCGIVNA
jgi:Domain of unknown function (DUF932)